ncbi:non-ribosomal peptide synthetase [Pseudonocardia sp. TRM90224]|uniref:non-ribosomal peptide synthetase n=1 Tax=Pseudonocardia sp. TRM90224 TaxID=2812678 RepID=UPI001E4F4529|nr:non-ribosomal peptide synthetase [Pseudonocardia sp. TRM90224]
MTLHPMTLHPMTLHPMTRGQQRLWFLHLLDPADGSFSMPVAARIRGPLDGPAFAAALDHLVERHDVLRSRFSDAGFTVTAGAVPLEQVDVSAAPDPVAAAELVVVERANRPFDLAAGPVLRLTLVRLGVDDHVFCIVMHHIVSDGWSVEVLFRELNLAYTALISGDAIALAPLPITYAEHARRGLDATPSPERVEFWKRMVEDTPVLDLPTDRPRPALRSGRGAQTSVELPPELVDALEKLARSERASMFIVLVAAFQLLLARHSGQHDVVVASPVIGRDTADVEGLVGYFTGLVLLRGDLSGEPAFRQLLTKTRRSVLEALTHQDVPFEQLPIPRDRAVAQAMLMYMRTGTTQPELGGLRVEMVDAGVRFAKVDLAMDVYQGPKGTGASVILTYDTDLFDAATAARFAGRFRVLLADVVAQPDARLGDLRMLEPAEQSALDAPNPPWTSGRPVPELITEQARSTPDLAAVEAGEATLTYAELDGRVGELAARLAALGVGAGDLVAVCLDRTVDLVAALLAVWRAGAGYVPLDPEHPAQRRELLVRDSAAVITSAAHAGAFPASVLVAVEAASPVAPMRACMCDPAGTAYVIHTSGSTGTPKGVVVEHAALAARVEWMRSAYGLGPGDRVVQFATTTVDAHAEEIFPALAAGATVVMLPDGGRSLPAFLATPAGRRTTVLDLPTAFWHRLVEDLDEVAWPAALRLVILGGEQVSDAAVRKWTDRFGDRVRLVNTYGPTEATIIVTAAELDGRASPTIGRPLPGSTARVLDEHGRPAPIGVAGELHLGGAGVARGYLGRPDLTEERFVPDPWGPPGARMFRTGDRARLRADGELEFLGRLDDQVKVRGFRIEPGEVEHALATHPGVRQVAVVGSGDELVAYAVGVAPDLRQHAARELPPHMVPTRWVTLAELPLTPAGKLDRAALPAPGPAAGTSDVPPRTDAEKLVADIWAELLDADRIGAHDDFFALGGHSLLALRVAARLRATADVDLPIRTLFRCRTVADLAVAVEEAIVAELAGLSDEQAMALLEREDAQ